MTLTTAPKMSHTHTDPAGRVEWPSLPPGHRWKVKTGSYDGWGDDHGIKVCLQKKKKLGIWWTSHSLIVSRQNNKNIFECTSLTAQQVLDYADRDQRHQEARRELLGIQQQDSY